MKRRVAFLIAMLTALLMITGCSGNNSNSGESSENQQTQQEETKAAAAYTLKAAGSEPAEITPEPGSYYARVSAEKGTTGTAAASVEPVQ